MIAKILYLIGLAFGPSPDKLPPGTVYIPPATSGKGAKGAKVVIPKNLFPNPLDKGSIIPAFWLIIEAGYLIIEDENIFPVYISSTKSKYKFSNMYDGCFNHLYHHER